jgi:hypothetical protein
MKRHPKTPGGIPAGTNAIAATQTREHQPPASAKAGSLQTQMLQQESDFNI